MTPEPQKSPSRDAEPVTDLSNESLSDSQQAELSDAARQEEYRKEFVLQQRRRACPGCGDDGSPYG